MKILTSTLKDIEYGGFFRAGYIVYNITANDNGTIYNLGDYLCTSGNKDEFEIKIREIMKKYTELGYELVGDWLD